MSNPDLPDDLLALVLVRLPLKCIYRFKIISKSWNALISSSEFIKMHQITLPITIDQQKPNIIVKNIDRDTVSRTISEQIYLVEFSTENFESGGDGRRLHHPFERLDFGMHSKIVGCCNGLLCQIFGPDSSAEYESRISLCNPLTKSSYWDLPTRPGLVVDQNQKKMRRRGICCYGFGYDDVHDDYKVIIASSPAFYNVNEFGYEYEYEIYSRKSDSWSRVRSHLDSRHHSFCCSPSFSDGVLLNSTLHWILRNHPPFFGDDDVHRNKWSYSILAFDLRTEKHETFPLPDYLDEKKHLRLSVLNGCLLISSYRRRYSDHDSVTCSFDYWVMMDYGVKGSVIKIPPYSLGPFRLEDSITPVTVLSDNEDGNNIPTRKLICYDSYEGMILVYDLGGSHQVQKFSAPGGYDYARQIQFVGSLVQPYPPSSEDTGLYRESKKHLLFRRVRGSLEKKKKLNGVKATTSEISLS